MKKRKRILEHLTNQELSVRTIKEIADEYFVHEVTVRDEFKRRGLTLQQKEEPTFNVTIEDLKEIPFARIAKREGTKPPILYRYVYSVYGIKKKEIYQMYLEAKAIKSNLEVLSDDEIRKPCAYLVKTYGTTGQKIRDEREKRGINFKENRFILIHVSDEDLFNLTLKELQAKYSVTADTICRERRRRKREKDNDFKPRARNVLKDVSNEELFGTSDSAIVKKYGVNKNTVYNERKKRRDNGTI